MLMEALLFFMAALTGVLLAKAIVHNLPSSAPYF